jgi:hypothetical protein
MGVGDLGEGGVEDGDVEDGDVIGGGVAARVPASQRGGEELPRCCRRTPASGDSRTSS